MKRLRHILLMVAIVSIPFDAIVNIGIARVSLTEVLFSVAFFASLEDMYRHRNEVLKSPVIVPVIAFLAACFLSLVNSSSAASTLRESIQFAWLFAILWFVVVTQKGGDVYSPAYALLVITAVVVSIVGIYQYFFVTEPIHFQVAGLRLRSHGFYDQPNTFGSFLIGVLPLLVVAYLVPAGIAGDQTGVLSRFYRWLGNKLTVLFLYTVGATGLVMSFSRGSWVGYGCALLFVAFFVRKMNLLKRMVAPIVIISLIGILVAVDVSVQPKKVDREFSNNQRALLLESSLNMLKDYPIFGIGLGNFPIRLAEYAPEELKRSIQWDYDSRTQRWFVNPLKESKIELVHNVFLQIAAETGIIGLAVFLYFLVQYFRCAFAGIQRSNTHRGKMQRIASLAGVIAILVGGIFGWPFSHGVQEVLVVLMALALA